MALSLAPTHTTVVDDVHTVSLCPAVSSHVSDVFPVHPLGICLALPIHRNPGPPVVSCSCLMELPGQGGNGFGEVGNGLALRHHCLYICCSCRRQVDEGIVRPNDLFYVVRSVVSPRASRLFLFSLVLPLRCLEVRLEVCPGFLSRFLSSHLSQLSYNRPVFYMSVQIVSTISSLAIVRPLLFANSWISCTRCNNSWNVLFASHGSENFERFPTRSWFSTCPYSMKRCATMSLTRIWVNARLQSNTTERNVLLTASAIFFPCSLQVDPFLEFPRYLHMVVVEVS